MVEEHLRAHEIKEPRINANRIFLTFGCSASADACKSKICVPPQTGFACLGFACAGIARRLEKC